MAFIVITYMGVSTCIKVEAAKKDPSIKENIKTLYIGYETYKIKISDLSKNAKVTYDSYDTSVASVSKSGIITPISVGDTSVIAIVQQEKKKYRLKVTVNVLKPIIKVTDSTDYLNVSESYSFKAEKFGIKGNIGWYVSDNTIANITSDGILKAIAAGKVTVYAKADDVIVECSLSIGTDRIGTLSKNITCYDSQTIWLTISDMLPNENLKATNNNSKVFDYKLGEKADNKYPLTIIPKSIGKDTLIIASDSSTDKLIITVNVVEKPSVLSKLTPKEVYEKCSSAIVGITATNKTSTIQGTGFFIANGTIVTNYHIIKGASSINITTKDKVQYQVQSILGYDDQTDLAILKIDSVNNNNYLTLSQSGSINGDDINSFGDPSDSKLTVSLGSVVTASYVNDNVNYIEISTPTTVRNSGGPLVNSYGEVIGINTITDAGAINRNFSISATELQKININRPITPPALIELNNRIKNNTVNENYIYSQYITNNQSIISGLGIQGSILTYEVGDYFRIKVTKTCLFTAVCYSDNYTDFDNTSFDLRDSNTIVMKNSSLKLGSLTHRISYNLNPGDYYINVHVNSNNSATVNIPYCFYAYFY